MSQRRYGASPAARRFFQLDTRLAWSGVGVMLGLGLGLASAAGASRVAAEQAAPHPVEWTGHHWARLEPTARQAYLAGFLAGAAAQQAGEKGTERLPARVAEEAKRLQRHGALAFPLRENVYGSHLDDYYFYQNRRERPLIQAILELTR